MDTVKKVEEHLQGQIALCEKDIAALRGDAHLAEIRLTVHRETVVEYEKVRDLLLAKLNQAEGAHAVLRDALAKITARVGEDQ